MKVERKRRNVAEHSLARHRKKLLAAGVPVEEVKHADPVTAHELLVNKVMELWRVAEAECDKLRPGLAPMTRATEQMKFEYNWAVDEQGNLVVTENPRLKAAAKLRHELAALTETAAKLGLDERAVRVKEEQTRLIGEALLRAALSAGFSPNQQRKLGAALREELATIEGTATVVS